MDKKRTQNTIPSHVCYSKQNEANAKSVTLSKEFVHIFTKIIFHEK